VWLRHRPGRTLRTLSALAFAAALAAGAACSSDPPARDVPPPSDPRPTAVPRAVSLPADEAEHSSTIEWWYYNGHLEAEDGREFGFHFVVFQAFTGGGLPVYSAQFALTDPERREHEASFRLAAGAQQDGPDLVNLQTGGWRLTIGESGHTVQASLEGTANATLELHMSPSVPAMLHNGTGWIGGPNGWTYYYSWPRMTSEGTLTLDEKDLRVTGEAWMDHQWGDFFILGYPAGWQWFAVQLDDGSSLMLQEFRDIEGKVVDAFGTYSGPAGKPPSRVLAPGEYTIQVLDHWRSPNTGAEYPSRWRITVPPLDLDIGIATVAEDQEITGGVPPAAIYWEGKVEVTGRQRDLPVAGNAYVELTGYVILPSQPMGRQNP